VNERKLGLDKMARWFVACSNRVSNRDMI